jgi:glycosyltransferase involved in cell wall biosynthesis
LKNKEALHIGFDAHHKYPMRRIGNHIAFVSNILSKYRVPCFSKLAEKMPGLVTFYFFAQKMEHRSIVLADQNHKIRARWLRGWKWRSPPKDDRHINNILPIIGGNHDLVVLSAWDEPSYVLLWLWGVFLRKKIIFWIESTREDGPRPGIKEAYKKLLLSQASGCIVPGRKSSEYCRILGMPEGRIFVAPNAVDRDYFRCQADLLLPRREELRRELGLSGVVLLFVGRLVEAYKNVSFLLRGFQRLGKSGAEVSLALVGDGPDRDKYEDMIKSKNISGVRFLGEMDHERLCRVYAASDIMVLPSRSETWGLVLNEAMEFGLPLVVSDAVGAGPDLVHPGENGFIVPSGDEGALVKALEKLANDPGLRTRMGEASRRIVEHFSPENWVAGVISAFDAVLRETRC